MTNKDQIKEDEKENRITLFSNKKRANYYRNTYEEEIKKERAKSGKKNEEFPIEYNDLYANSMNNNSKEKGKRMDFKVENLIIIPINQKMGKVENQII